MIFFRKPVPTPDQVRGRLFRDHALARVCTHKIAIGDSDLLNVRFGPLYGLKSGISRGPKSATSGCEQSQQKIPYSITLVAWAITIDGNSMPRALAVFRLIARSNFTGACTGRSAGFAPLRI